MQAAIADTWFCFCITFGVMQLASFVMGLQGKKFYTKDPAIRKFSILDLELAANGKEIRNIIQGIFLLPGDQSPQVVSALRGQLVVDFIFMPGAYLSIYLLCMKTAAKLTTVPGKYIFAALAWGQLLAWLCDIIENVCILYKLSPGSSEMPGWGFKAYRINEWIKWGLSLTGAVCGIFSMLYFWLVGDYSIHSFTYLFIVLAEIVVFAVAAKVFSH